MAGNGESGVGNGENETLDVAASLSRSEGTSDPAITAELPVLALPNSDSPLPIPRPIRIALIAGEASGDQLGAGLIAELKKRHPDALFVGVGGAGMRAAGLDAWHDCSALAVMGLAEVARHLPRLLRLRSALRKRLLDWRPDVFIGIDAPDFNLGLERALKQRGIRTVHYVSPSVWAWREKRAAKIGLSADRVLCLFPMEPAIYARYGVDARYVGHPLAGMFAMEPDATAARAALALPSNGTLIALMPGSRLGEIKKLGIDFLRTCVLLLRERPKLKFVAPMANAGCRTLFASQLARVAAGPDAAGLREAVLLLDGRAHEALIASDVALLASGTAALEAMLAKRPMVVAYRVARLTQAMVRGFGMMKIQRYSLPNVLAGEALVPELIQGDCTPPLLKDAVLAWLNDPARVEVVTARFHQLHAQLDRDASALAADAVDELLPARP